MFKHQDGDQSVKVSKHAKVAWADDEVGSSVCDHTHLVIFCKVREIRDNREAAPTRGVNPTVESQNKKQLAMDLCQTQTNPESEPILNECR
jgi:hypothetical protein